VLDALSRLDYYPGLRAKSRAGDNRSCERAERALQIKGHSVSRKASSLGDGRQLRRASGASPARFQKASRTSRFI
jgi:hypothetical protein